MSKKSKKRANRIRNLLGGAVLLAPAMLAAATAFMNTTAARDRGKRKGQGDGLSLGFLDTDGGTTSKGKSRSRKRK